MMQRTHGIREVARWFGCILLTMSLSVGCTSHRVEMPTGDSASMRESMDVGRLVSRVQYGVASWYGKKFHGRTTANGETYNMYASTAAHRWAAFGTRAIVTNLSNGKQVQVRINDRGPVPRQRVLDLSYGAARRLDMVQSGVARVKIAFLSPAQDSPAQDSEELFTVQAGAYRDYDNAMQVQQTLAVWHSEVAINQVENGLYTYYRVRLGRFARRQEAESLAQQVVLQGYTAKVVPLLMVMQNSP